MNLPKIDLGQKILNTFEILAETPTTSLRMYVTFILSIATAFKYLLSPCIAQLVSSTGACVSWQPSQAWLMFIAALGGIDVLQYAAKRSTAWKPTDMSSTTPSESDKG